MRENIAKNLCKVIALANQKGGVAKSFTTASLAVGLVNSGNRVYIFRQNEFKTIRLEQNRCR